MFKQIRLPGGGERYPKTWGKTRNNDGKTIRNWGDDYRCWVQIYRVKGIKQNWIQVMIVALGTATMGM